MNNLQLDQADILIDLAQQKLYLPRLDRQYLISTGKMELAKLKTVARLLVAGTRSPKIWSGCSLK